MKSHLHEPAKSGGVVVPDGLGVAVRLQDGVGVDNTILQVGFLLCLGFTSLLLHLRRSEDSEVGDDLLGVLGLAGTGLASDEHGLVPGLVHHALVGSLGDGEQVRRDLIPPLADVELRGQIISKNISYFSFSSHLDHTVSVDRVTLVRVDDDAEQAGVGLEQEAGTDNIKMKDLT